MEKEYDKMIQAASDYPQASTVCSQQQHDSAITNDSVISEDERTTIRLSPVRRKDADAIAKESFYNSAQMLDRLDAEQSEESVSEIALASLGAADQMLIHTKQSLYVFTIIDPESISGRLRGGILGDQKVDAFLLPSWVESRDSKITHKSIKAGVKFTFILEEGKGLQRLTTSTVKSLIHRKKARPATLLKRMPGVTLEQVSD